MFTIAVQTLLAYSKEISSENGGGHLFEGLLLIERYIERDRSRGERGIGSVSRI
jgi:hypothetical protein